jgi:hypothetical protein
LDFRDGWVGLHKDGRQWFFQTLIFILPFFLPRRPLDNTRIPPLFVTFAFPLLQFLIYPLLYYILSAELDLCDFQPLVL